MTSAKLWLTWKIKSIVHVSIYSNAYHVIIDFDLTVEITNHNSHYSLSPFNERTHTHYKKVERMQTKTVCPQQWRRRLRRSRIRVKRSQMRIKRTRMRVIR
jgi:hypothetical protein